MDSAFLAPKKDILFENNIPPVSVASQFSPMSQMGLGCVKTPVVLATARGRGPLAFWWSDIRIFVEFRLLATVGAQVWQIELVQGDYRANRCPIMPGLRLLMA